MTSPLRRFVLLVAVLALTASACSGADELPDDVVVADDGALVITESGADDPQEDDGAPAGTSIPVPADDSAADAAIAGLDDQEDAPAGPTTPAEITQDFMRSQFNIDPKPEWVGCIIDQGSSDPVLEQALQQPSIIGGGTDDAQLKSLAFAINGCVDTASLADWTTQAIGPRGDVAETAPPCFTEKYDDPDTGDAVFYNFVALTRQFRLDPPTTPDLVATLVECAPINGLTDFFATSEEQASNLRHAAVSRRLPRGGPRR